MSEKLAEHVENEENETFENHDIRENTENRENRENNENPENDDEEDDLFAEDAKSDEISKSNEIFENIVIKVENESPANYDFEESIEIVKEEALDEDDEECNSSFVQGTMKTDSFLLLRFYVKSTVGN